MLVHQTLSYNDYEFIKILGCGSFAYVNLVRNIQTGKLSALKCISLIKMKNKQCEGAINEVRLLSAIHIPNVIRYQGLLFNAQKEELGILMQYADGGDLQNKIKQKEYQGGQIGLNQNQIWKTTLDILKGLKKLHENKIIHRDIKTANIFFVNGVAKLGDLNVSRILDRQYCSTITGTPYYMSPQIWKGHQYDQKCDIWSLGCVIYEMCTYKTPFMANSYPQLIKKITQCKYVQIGNKYSQNLKEIIKLCLSSQPSMRYSAKKLLELAIFRQGQTTRNCSGIIKLIDINNSPHFMNYFAKRIRTQTRNTYQGKQNKSSYLQNQKSNLNKQSKQKQNNIQSNIRFRQNSKVKIKLKLQQNNINPYRQKINHIKRIKKINSITKQFLSISKEKKNPIKPKDLSKIQFDSNKKYVFKQKLRQQNKKQYNNQ